MANLIGFLKNSSIGVLGLPVNLERKLLQRQCHTLMGLFSSLQLFKAGKESCLKDFEIEEIEQINIIFKEHLAQSDLSPTPSKPLDTSSAQKHNGSALMPLPPKRPGSRPVKNPYLHIAEPRLIEFESIFQSKLKNIDLVGEILITRDELNELSALFRRIFEKNSSNKVLDIFEKILPACYIVYLVAQGVYGYNGGDYWTAVNVALNPPTNFHFGHLFEILIKRYGLVVFEELQNKSTHYVSLILAHGGIPVYSLDDYFNNLILPSIIRPQYSGLEGSELVDALLDSSLVTTTDKPVIHFLEYGGRVAQDVFNRSRRLVLNWQQTQTIPPIEEIGLPGHMVDFFTEWVKNQGVSAVSVRGPRTSIRKPDLCLDPWGIGVFFKLPAQSMPLLDEVDYEWQVNDGKIQQRIPVQIDTQGWTKEYTVRIDIPTDSYSVKFCAGLKEYVWVFNTPGKIFFFDPAKSTLLNHPLNEETWILYPRQLYTRVDDGDGTQIEELPALPGHWYQLRVEGWDLSDTKKLSFMQQEMIYKSFDIKRKEVFYPLTLTNGTLLETNLSGEEIYPVYLGKPPVLRIPIVTGNDPNEYINRWRISIKAIGAADPNQHVQFLISELPDIAYIIKTDCIDVQLDHKVLLNSRPIGTFEISAYGPLGQDAKFIICIIPDLNVKGIAEVYIPNRKGAPQVNLAVDLGLTDYLQPKGGSSNIRIQTNRPGKFSLIVPPDISRLDMQVLREYLDDEIIVPFSLRVRRLRWRLVTQDVLEKWSDELLDVSIPSFLRLNSPLLIISLPGITSQTANLYLRLLDINGTELIRIQPAGKSTKYPSDFWRFDLSVLQSNLRETAAPILRLELVGDGVMEGVSIALPVVSFTQAIDIRSVVVQSDELPEHYQFRVSWNEFTHLQNRNIYLWSIWRPWQPVQSLSVPDHVSNYFEFLLAKDQLVKGQYRLGFAIVDPWVGGGPPVVPPDEGTLWTGDFEISASERQAYLGKFAQSFDEHLELAMINTFSIDTCESPIELKWCCKNIRLATSQQVLILFHLLKQTEQEELLELLGENVISPAVLAQMLNYAHGSSGVVQEVSELLRYAPHPSKWTDSACELLFDFEDYHWRINALRGLVNKKPQKAVKGVLSLIKSGAISLEDAVELLYENKPNVIEPLKSGHPKNATAQKLLELLSLYNPDTGLPTVRPGTWVRTNAGWGKIEEIQDITSHASVEEFMINQGAFKLFVRLHIEMDPAFQGERAIIDMQKKTVAFPRAKQVYCCEYCHDFVTATRDMYRSHILLMHSGKYLTPPSSTTTIFFNTIEFDHSRK